MRQAVEKGKELAGVERLKQVTGSAAADRGEQVLVFGRHGEHHDADLGSLSLDQAGGRHAVAARHVDVHEDQVGGEAAGLLQRLEAVARLADDLDAAAR